MWRRRVRLADVHVVSASASGVQVADELIRTGNEVAIAVGRHTRMPSRYRGMDSFWWLEATGRLARTIGEVPNIAAARRENPWLRVPVLAPDGSIRVTPAPGLYVVGQYFQHRRGATPHRLATRVSAA